MALIFLSSKEGTSYNAKTQTEYLYENSVYFDDELQKKVYKRRVIGKIDPETGEKIPTGPVGRPRQERVFQRSSVPETTNIPLSDDTAKNQDTRIEKDQVQAILKCIDNLTEEMNRLRSLLVSFSGNET